MPEFTHEELQRLETMVVSEMNSIIKHGGEEEDLEALTHIANKIEEVLYP